MTHVRLADHLWKLKPFDSLRRNELMFHLLKANLLKDIVGLYGMAHEAEETQRHTEHIIQHLLEENELTNCGAVNWLNWY